MRSGARCLLLHLPGQRAAGIHQLRARPVVQRQRERRAGVARRCLLRPLHLVLHFARQFVHAADVADAHIVVHHALHVALEIALQQPHQEVDFGPRTTQIVLERKGVERQPRKPDARSRLRHQLHALRALLMAQKALQRSVTSPAAVAVHDDGDVLGQTLRLERVIDRALL